MGTECTVILIPISLTLITGNPAAILTPGSPRSPLIPLTPCRPGRPLYPYG